MASFKWRADAEAGLLEIGADSWETDSSPQVLQALKAAAPIDSGRLRDNIVLEGRKTSGRSIIFTYRSRAISDEGFNYPPVVIMGRGPVVAKNAKALRFVAKPGRVVVFRKSVGPTKPNNYLYEGLRRSGLLRPRKLS